MYMYVVMLWHYCPAKKRCFKLDFMIKSNVRNVSLTRPSCVHSCNVFEFKLLTHFNIRDILVSTAVPFLLAFSWKINFQRTAILNIREAAKKLFFLSGPAFTFSLS